MAWDLRGLEVGSRAGTDLAGEGPSEGKRLETGGGRQGKDLSNDISVEF